jgi:DNA relaxase NicK
LAARFGAKYRDIPYDILERPWEYLTGHYPPLSWISEHSTRMETAVAKAAASMCSSLRHAKRQCGAVVNAISKVFTTPAEFTSAVVALLVRNRLPAWVESSPLGVAVLAPVLRPDFQGYLDA